MMLKTVNAIPQEERVEPGVVQIAMCKSNRKNPNQYRVYSKNGLAPCLNKAEGGGRTPYIYPNEEEKPTTKQVIVEDFYKNRPLRVYEDVAPTVRSGRQGLKVVQIDEDKRSNN